MNNLAYGSEAEEKAVSLCVGYKKTGTIPKCAFQFDTKIFMEHNCLKRLQTRPIWAPLLHHVIYYIIFEKYGTPKL